MGDVWGVNHKMRFDSHGYNDGDYFVTVKTYNRVPYFGELISSEEFRYSEIGRIAEEYWQMIPVLYPEVSLGEFIIMPEHLHGVIKIEGIRSSKSEGGVRFGPQSKNLPSIVRGYKSSVKRYANQHGLAFEWQSRYWEIIIRNESMMDRIEAYIRNNRIAFFERKKTD